ncbi:MAG: hypothetical protein ABJR46_01020 [Tateyamaria sp.]|uniref:hypothetical protein n=1 Tax=Tateyamaria sp. TaxID=1929288 RepID=UPI00328A0570
MLSSLPLRTIAIAGLVGELLFEAYAWLVSPLVFGVTLEPANLVTALFKMYLGVQLPYPVAFVIHVGIGIVGFGLAVWCLHRLTKLPLVAAGVVSGFVLWFVAQGFLAQLVGRDFMMGFGAYTQSSFFAHVGMAAVMGLIMALLTRSKPAVTQA